LQNQIILTFENYRDMEEIQLINGKWKMNGKVYTEMHEVEKKIFGVLIAVEKIIRKYNL
jgi:hypothetical protein